ncbi:MAG: hypothetical protein HUU26_03320 [Gemmatimonadaceae bacterium]|nr:hypothetical protein [Gemmatimonadaceae bacterium]
MRPPRVLVMLSDAAVTVVRLDIADGGLRVAERDGVVPDTLFTACDFGELAVRTREALAELEAADGPVTLVIPANWAFTHVVESQPRRTGEALAFEVETFLPVGLEDLTIVFVPNGRATLAIAVPTQPVRQLLTALEREGVTVEHLLVDTVVVASRADDDRVILIRDERWLRGCTVATEGGRDFVLRASPAELGAVLAEWTGSDESPRPATVLDLRRAVPEGSHPPLETHIESVGRDAAIEQLARAAAGMEDGDLRVGPLGARGRWSHVEQRAQAALAAAILLLVGVLAGLHVRSRALNEQVADLYSAQLKVYGTVFPVDTLPAGAALRLASERKRLEGLTRPSPAAPRGPEAEPLDVFRGFVAALPADVRVYLEQARLDETQVSLRGRTAEHRDAERIVEALGKVPGVVVRPPRTTRLADGGVEFSILARRAGDAP